jgi:hypothetical protein
MPLKVLQVIAAVADRYGGPSRNVVGLCAATRAVGVEAEICTTDADGPRAALAEALPGLQTWRGVPVRFFHRSWSERYKISPPLARWLRTSVMGYDLVVVHGCFSHAPEAAWLYFIGECLRRNGDPRARSYLWKAARRNPVGLKSWIRLVQLGGRRSC